MQPPNAHELVARGARVLDEKLPGWADQIDLDRLQMRDACNCVLGQIGGKQYNLDALGWHKNGPANFYDLEGSSNLDMLALGFDCDVNWSNYYLFYDELQDAWTSAIVERWTL